MVIPCANEPASKTELAQSHGVHLKILFLRNCFSCQCLSFTGRRPRARQAGAWQRLRPSPCGTPPEASRRPGQWGEPGRGQRRTPIVFVSNLLLLHHVHDRNDAYQLGVADKLAGEPKEGLLEVVVGLGRDVVVLEVLLAVESDGLGLDLALLDIDLVAAQDNGDVLADTDEVT